MNSSVQIAVVEDAARVRRELISTLNAHPGWKVVAECANAVEALQLLPEARPDLILLDIILRSEDDGIKLIAPLKKLMPKAVVVMLTVVEHEVALARAIRAGAAGYIIKRDRAHLVAGIEDVLAGRVMMSPSVARQLWTLAQRHLLAVSPKDHGLTAREWEVLKLGARGKQQGEIARELGIEINTVKKHCCHIYEKLGVGSMMEAVAKLQGVSGLPDD